MLVLLCAYANACALNHAVIATVDVANAAVAALIVAVDADIAIVAKTKDQESHAHHSICTKFK